MPVVSIKRIMSRKTPFIFLLLTCLTFNLLSQGWEDSKNSPGANWRHDDVYFLNEEIGWICNLKGQVFQTRNGGETWLPKFFDISFTFRCIGFADSLHGWAGNIGNSSWTVGKDKAPLFETFDGGKSWQEVTQIIDTNVKGICGIHVLDKENIFAVGRVSAPAFFLRSNDGGKTWITQDMRSEFRSLIDVYFFNKNEGMIVGNTTSNDFLDSYPKIMNTTDGGKTWTTTFQGTRKGHLCWKINFPESQIGYVSLEAKQDSVFILKSENRGQSWKELLVSPVYSRFQGIGFINKDTGWVGSSDCFKTTDGGNSWKKVPFVTNFNRFRQVNERTSYAVGNKVWKYTDSTKVISNINTYSAPGYHLEQNFPNPFKASTMIKYSIPKQTHVTLTVFDFGGRAYKTLVDEVQQAGNHEVEFVLNDFDESVLFYSLRTNDYQTTKNMVFIKN